MLRNRNLQEAVITHVMERICPSRLAIVVVCLIIVVEPV